MVNKEVILDTVRKMYESGIEDSVIEATLCDIGMGQEEAKQYLLEVKGKPISQPELDSQSQEQSQDSDSFSERDSVAEQTAFRVKEHLDAERQERELHQTTQQVAMDEQQNKIAGLDQKVSEIHQKIDFTASPTNKQLASNLDGLYKRIDNIETQLADIQASSNATRDLMKKILEANRSILNKL